MTSKVATFQQLTLQDTEPDFDLIEPGRMFRCIDEAYAMSGIGQELGA